MKTQSTLHPVCPHPSWIEIDLDQFRTNLAALRGRAEGALLCLPVKANAYGHGLLEMGRAAERFGVDYLGVSCLQEGARLRLGGIAIPILVFGAIHEDQVRDLITWNLEFTVSSRFKAVMVAKKCEELGKRCSVHLEVDTGMHRTGVRPETAQELIGELLHSKHLQLKGVYSHFATADQPNHPVAFEQIEKMKQLKERFKKEKMIWHLANSGGVLYYPESHFDMVRPGLAAYGYLPDGRKDPLIRPCLSLKSKISYFKVVGAGAGISYGHHYKTAGQTRVVTVPVGYGDGYRRSLSHGGQVMIRGKKYRVSGTICMDQFMVDIGQDEAYVGEEVVLLGRQGNEEISLEEMAYLTQTIPYELLVTLNERLVRLYI